MWSAIAALATCPTLNAQPLEIEARAGAQLPLGRSEQGQALIEEVTGAAPIGLGLGVRLFDVWYAGVDGAIAPAWMGGSPPKNTACNAEYRADERCGVTTFRAGVMAGYQHVTRSRWQPWARIGFAFERVGFAGHVDGISDTDPNAPRRIGKLASALSGWVVQSRLGADYVLAPRWRLGAFVSFDGGAYTRRDVDESYTARRLPIASADITERAAHYWLGAGVRVAFVAP